jgi:hypothetical protein
MLLLRGPLGLVEVRSRLGGRPCPLHHLSLRESKTAKLLQGDFPARLKITIQEQVRVGVCSRANVLEVPLFIWASPGSRDDMVGLGNMAGRRVVAMDAANFGRHCFPFFKNSCCSGRFTSWIFVSFLCAWDVACLEQVL